jgi:hypothetical protein
VVTANNQTVAYNQSISLSNVFSVTGTGVTQYQVWFSYPEGGAPALGTVTNNGTPIPLDQSVTAASLSGLTYTGSATSGTDYIWLKAFNGAWNESWARASIADAGSATNASVGTGATASADSSYDVGPVAIGEGETVELGTAYSGMVTFLADSGILQLDNASSFAGTVSGLAGHDSLDLRDIAVSADASLSYLSTGDSGGTLRVGDGTHTANLALLGNYMAGSFITTSDGQGGTLITLPQQGSEHPIAASTR